ncbi:MAG TPA: phosphatidylserine decarboxylase [Ferrovibrio sp.]|uniref:phosphatidylserine decarboxylase n=1 Tax=Ferrovibrio sp. TaxID=1917215 RepID=UPI002ED4283F
MDTIRSVLVPIHREGWKFIAIFAVATLVLFWIATPLGWIGVVLTCWCAYFFRDPDRVTPLREGLLISPADGVVQMIERAVPPEELGMGVDPRLRISIFMNVFDVHVNRSPVDGVVTAMAYRPGSFVNAALDKASVDNERQALRIRLANGKEIAVVQIAGLVARRILCDVKEGQALKAGERFGMIRFGSRVDVYLDDGMVPLAVVGQRAVAGETVIAEDNASEQPRLGEVR